MILATARTPLSARLPDGERTVPRVDYLELQRLIDADVLDFGVYRRAARLIEPIDRVLRLAWYQAWYAVRHWNGYDTVLSLSEDIGLPMRYFMRVRGLKARHILVAHHVRASRKRLLVRAMGGLKGFDRVIALSDEEHAAVVSTYGVPPDRAMCLPHRVEEQFWQPLSGVNPEPDLVCSFGLAKRDYPTLLDAVRGQPVRLRIQAQ